MYNQCPVNITTSTAQSLLITKKYEIYVLFVHTVSVRGSQTRIKD